MNIQIRNPLLKVIMMTQNIQLVQNEYKRQPSEHKRL